MNPQDLATASYWVWVWNTYGKELAYSAMAAVVRIAAVVVAYLVVRFLLLKLINRIWIGSLARMSGDLLQARQATVWALQSLLKSVIGFVLAFVAFIMILQAAGVRVETLLATAGVAGIAIGFGAQKLVRDMISGFFVLAEDQYGVGDYVSIGAMTGTVEELGMRITRLRDNQGRLYTVANGDVNQVCNYSRGKLRVSQDIAVPTASDVAKAQQVLNDVGARIAEDMPAQVKSPFECEGIVQISGASATLRFSGIVAPHHQDEVQMELNARIRSAFEKHGLTLA